MIGSTWLHISDWHQTEEKEFDRQAIRAVLIRDIEGWTASSPDLFMKDFIIFNRNIAYSRKAEEYDAVKRDLSGSVRNQRCLPDSRKRYVEKSEGKR